MARLRASHFGDALARLCYMWNERCRSCSCTIPTFSSFPYQQLHVMSLSLRQTGDRVSPCQASCPRLVCGSQTTLSLHTDYCTSLHPGKRGGGDRRSRNPPNPPPPRKSVGRCNFVSGDDHWSFVTWRECGRVVHIHLPVVLRGGLAGEAEMQGRATPAHT
jgi:hypothetical protein